MGVEQSSILVTMYIRSTPAQYLFEVYYSRPVLPKYSKTKQKDRRQDLVGQKQERLRLKQKPWLLELQLRTTLERIAASYDP